MPVPKRFCLFVSELKTHKFEKYFPKAWPFLRCKEVCHNIFIISDQNKALFKCDENFFPLGAKQMGQHKISWSLMNINKNYVYKIKSNNTKDKYKGGGQDPTGPFISAILFITTVLFSSHFEQAYFTVHPSF